MRASRPSIRRIIAIVPLIAIVTLAACSEQEQPFAVGDRATPTATPTDVEQAQAAAAAPATPTAVPLPTSVPISIPTSVPVPTSVPTPTEVPSTPAPTATAVPSGQPPGSTASTPSPTPVPEPTATLVPEPTATPAPQVPPTHTPVPIPADYNRSTDGPPSNELIKFSQWDENRVKLSNWVAGYVVAHGLDHPVRVITMNPEDYKDALPNGEIDIVMEADPAWAKPWADAGVIVLLGPLSDASGDTVIAVNASIWRRAPNVGQFMEKYEWSGAGLSEQAGKIRSGRVGVKENIVGLKIIEEQPQIWTPWVDATAIAGVNLAIAEGKPSHCREVEERQSTGSVVRVCIDDPSKAVCSGCQ